ncbi:competence protein CoiA [Solibacillus isronensis]|uniref:competence protein CoiA n=1 Tax=Solibacillus isronensis TaxID=412383 RepID=UPI001590ACEB|nr:competence protein CoiA family protein [Solibacillus isronensis]
MLVAMTEQQQLFHLTSKYPLDELQKLKKQQSFFCPQCKEQLLLKAGQIKIPHFAHQKNSECDSLFSEGESAAHLLGKQQLFHHFSNLQLRTVLEPYLPQLQQRPDLLLTFKNRQYAVEFQCSPIAKPSFQQRTSGYLHANITPIWILHTPDKFKGTGILKVSINHTNTQFIQQYKKQKFLITYDVKSKTFYYISNLIHLHKLQYFAVVKKLPLSQQRFPLLVPEKISKSQFHLLLKNYRKYREYYIHPRLLLSKKGVNDQFFRSIYELRLTMTDLPIFLGIPVCNTHAFNQFCIEWQVGFFHFMDYHALTPKTMNERAIPYFFKWSKLELTDERKAAVEHYLAILRHLNIEQLGENITEEQLFNVLYDELVAFGC